MILTPSAECHLQAPSFPAPKAAKTRITASRLTKYSPSLHEALRLHSPDSQRRRRRSWRRSAQRLTKSAATSQPHLQQQQADATVLLDIRLPAAPAAVCEAIFGRPACVVAGCNNHGSGTSWVLGGAQLSPGLLAEHLQQGCGCTELAAQPWQLGTDNRTATRVVQYIKPLSPRQRVLLPLGPPAVQNREEQQLVLQLSDSVNCNDCNGSSNGSSRRHVGSSPSPSSNSASTHIAYLVTSTCTSSGVPFSDCFTNLLSWQLLPAVTTEEAAAHAAEHRSSAEAASGGLQPRSGSWEEADGTRVLLTAICRFHRPVLGPLRGQIERESIQGMKEVYSGFKKRLLHHFSAAGRSRHASNSAGDGMWDAAASRGISNARQSSSLSTPGAGAGRELSRGGGSLVAAAGSAATAAHLEGGASTHVGAGGLEATDAAWVAAVRLARQHLTAPTAAGMLHQAEALWPDWSAACCRLPAAYVAGDSQGLGLVQGQDQQREHSQHPYVAPTPAEAAAVLQQVASNALSLPLQQRQQELAKNRVVQGLVEALRLRSDHESTGAITAAASKNATPTVGTAPAGTLPPSTAALDTQGGTSSSPCQLPALGSAAAVAAALWSLAVLGGSIFWEEEAEALCALLPACSFGKLPKVCDVVWALATMRHHTPHLPLLEQQAVAFLRQMHVAAAADPADKVGGQEGSTGGAAGSTVGRKAGSSRGILASAASSEVSSSRISPAAEAGSREDNRQGSTQSSPASAAGSQQGNDGLAPDKANGSQEDGSSDRAIPPRLPSLSKVAVLLWGLVSLGHRPVLLLELLPTLLSHQQPRMNVAGSMGDSGSSKGDSRSGSSSSSSSISANSNSSSGRISSCGSGISSNPTSSSSSSSSSGQFTALCSMGWSLAASGCLQHPAVAVVAAGLAAAAAGMPLARDGAGSGPAVRKAVLLQLHQFALALELEIKAEAEKHAVCEVNSAETGRQTPVPPPLPTQQHQIQHEKQPLPRQLVQQLQHKGNQDDAAAQREAAAGPDRTAGHGKQGQGVAAGHSRPRGPDKQRQFVAAAAGDTRAAAAAAAWHLLQQQPAMQQLLAAAAATWQSEQRHLASKQVSACQADVATTARGGLGLAVREECSASGLSVDIAVPARRLVIEVDGPTHFCRNTSSESSCDGKSRGSDSSSRSSRKPQEQVLPLLPIPAMLRPVGGTLLKRRLLRRQGWVVVSVCTTDWEQLRGASQKRLFLQQAIAAAERDGSAG